MSSHNRDVIRRSRCCLKRLAKERVQEAFAYGERDVREVLYDLTFEVPVKVKMICDHYDNAIAARDAVPLEIGAASGDKIIIASVINTQERIRRLVQLGVDPERFILLN
jgi:hypothetical protein